MYSRIKEKLDNENYKNIVPGLFNNNNLPSSKDGLNNGFTSKFDIFSKQYLDLNIDNESDIFKLRKFIKILLEEIDNL